MIIECSVEKLGFFFFFNDTATTEIYTLSLHDALPISQPTTRRTPPAGVEHFLIEQPDTQPAIGSVPLQAASTIHPQRSEEHTSELQSRQYLVCRLLLEKKKI